MDFAIFFKNKSLKKIPKVGIHFEQKTTPDLLWCVAQVILDITKNDHSYIFSDKEDVRKSPIFNNLMQDYFSKPPQSQAEDEYNKVSSYQLGLMVFAGLLEEVGERPKRFKILNREALEYIALNDLNASKFLTEYTEKFAKDNGLLLSFERYRSNPTQQNYVQCKEDYWRWARINTDVRTNNPQHSYRVYNKIFNVLCYKNRVQGQYHSNISDGPCPYSYLIYNRDNFRDKDKPTGMTRQAYIDTVFSDIDQEGVVATLLKKAKESIARKYGDSEIKDPELGYLPENGIHVHHIIPISYNAKFSLVRENLIALTPGQHLSYAHARGNTKIVTPKYQAICLNKKLEHITSSLSAGEDFYNYSNFIDVVNACYSWDLDHETTSEELTTMLDEKISSLS
jgi:hypothetical protein